MPLKSTKIQLEGTPQQIEEAIRRLRHVFEVSSPSRLYQSRRDPEIFCCYLRCYTYRDSDTLLEQLAVAQSEIAALEHELGELCLENERLMQELGLLPKPRPYDAVLSPKVRGASDRP